MQAQRTDFQVWTRLIFNLLRGHHHLLQIKKGARTNEIPPSFRGIKNFLSQVASPALPTVSTATLLRGNASNWLQTNLQILESHYEDLIAGVRTNLLRPVHIDHQRAWEVAVDWAESKYSISEEVMSRVKNDLRDVGLRIDRIPRGTPLRALMDVPTKRPHLGSRHNSRGTATSLSSPPSTGTRKDPRRNSENQPTTSILRDPNDPPPAATVVDQDPPTTQEEPIPEPPTFPPPPFLGAQD